MTNLISSSLLLPLLFSFLLSCPLLTKAKNEGSTVNGMFVFGSSLVDNGNNNFFETTSKADYLPYGIDYPLGPTGRFSNGKNVIDALSELLKLPGPIPAFLNPATRDDGVVYGVDYASGGSGILDDTGFVSGRVITLNQQIKNFEEVTLANLSTSQSNYLFVIGSGGNDYLLNYFLRNATRQVSLQNFTTNLTQTLSTQIQKLHKLGARKFVLISVYPLGCIPLVKKTFSANQECVDSLNQAAQLFNSHLKSLVDVLTPKLPGSSFVYVDEYKIIMDILDSPAANGFNDINNACCEVPSLAEGGNGLLCKRNGSTCDDRRGHVFFDGLHPTEKVNCIIARKAWTSRLPTEVYPINVGELVKL
ncbi:hypothetical protein ACHQM5_001967 [Ranunculus cassubicifolius]